VALSVDQVYRDFNTNAVPSSGEYKPVKPEIRALLKQIQNSGGLSVTRNTLTALNAVTPPTENYMGIVLSGTGAGYYSRVSGVWTFGRAFPDTFAQVVLSGAGGSRTGALAAGVIPSAIEVFFAKVSTPNTGALTLSIGGESSRPVVNLAGNPLSAGEWTGMVMFYLNDAGQYQLLFDSGSALAAATSASAADVDADRAEAALGTISGYTPNGNIVATAFHPTSGDIAIPDSLSAVGATKKEVDLSGQTWTMASQPSNQFGTKFNRGKVLVPSLISGQLTQLNSYAPDVNGLMVGRENLYLFWKFVTLGTTNVFMYGDSTVEQNPVDTENRPNHYFHQALKDAGCDVVSVINRGKSGTSWSDLNVSAINFEADNIPGNFGSDLGPNTHLIVIKYGINDAGKSNPLVTMMADARAKLAAIRAAPNGSPSQVSILLMGPNSTYRPSGNQDAKWYEDLRNCYVQLALEFDCGYFDTYAYLQQTKRAPGVWMDDLVGIGQPGEGLHPDSFASRWIYHEGILRFVLGHGSWNPSKTNHFWNESYSVPRKAADAPAAYPKGISFGQALNTDGFPFAGFVVTFRGVGDLATQWVYDLSAYPRTVMRTGTTFAWTNWTNRPVALTGFSNGWGNKGAGFADAGYQVGDDGFVTLFGTLAGGSNLAIMLTLPSGARPPGTCTFRTGANAQVGIFAGGEVTIDTSDTSNVSLDGIRFRLINTF